MERSQDARADAKFAPHDALSGHGPPSFWCEEQRQASTIAKYASISKFEALGDINRGIESGSECLEPSVHRDSLFRGAQKRTGAGGARRSHGSESRLLLLLSLLLVIQQHCADRSPNLALRVLETLRPETRDHLIETSHEGVLVGRGDS